MWVIWCQSYRVFNLKVNIFNHRLGSLNFILVSCSITHFDPDISTFDDFTFGVLRSWALSQLHIVSSHCNMVIMLTHRTKFIWSKQYIKLLKIIHGLRFVQESSLIARRGQNYLYNRKVVILNTYWSWKNTKMKNKYWFYDHILCLFYQITKYWKINIFLI